MKAPVLPAAFALVLALGLHAAPAQAQLARTYVSAASGDDANNCDRPTPCRTFQAAHDKTLGNGEITVLDPGGYGAVTIAKTISIINDGVGEAGVLVSGGAVGISISAAATDAVSLRGLTIKGIGFGGGRGIRFNSGKSLTVENCIIRNLSGVAAGNGIVFAPTDSGSLVVSNTFIADNTGHGIIVQPSGAGSVKAVFNRVEAHNNGVIGIRLTGALSTGPINGTAVDSVAAGNGDSGFYVDSAAGHSAATLTVVRSVAAGNGLRGIFAIGTGAVARVGRSTIAGNGTGVAVSGGGLLWSYADNNIDGNGTDGAPATTPLK